MLQWIRAHVPGPAVPVIALTTATSKRDLRGTYRLGAKSCLLKPSHPDELVKLVETLKGYWSTPEPGARPENYLER